MRGGRTEVPQDEHNGCVRCKVLSDELAYMRILYDRERRLNSKITLRSLRANGVTPAKPTVHIDGKPEIKMPSRQTAASLKNRLERHQREKHIPIPVEALSDKINELEQSTGIAKDPDSLHSSNGDVGLR